jgi:hypothetical protein
VNAYSSDDSKFCETVALAAMNFAVSILRPAVQITNASDHERRLICCNRLGTPIFRYCGAIRRMQARASATKIGNAKILMLSQAEESAEGFRRIHAFARRRDGE